MALSAQDYIGCYYLFSKVWSAFLFCFGFRYAMVGYPSSYPPVIVNLDHYNLDLQTRPRQGQAEPACKITGWNVISFKSCCLHTIQPYARQTTV